MNSAVNSTRLRLVALWVAVFARAVGEYAVGAYAVLRYSNGLTENTVGFLFLMLGLTAVPAFALAPLTGALACSKQRWRVMVLATMVGLGAIAFTSFDEVRSRQAFWYGCIALLALEAAFFSACRFALIPEAARAARVSLPQLNGVFLVAMAGGMLLGLWIGVHQYPRGKEPGLPIPLQLGHIGYGIALICLLLARFPVANPIRVNAGLVVPFVKTARAILGSRNGRNSLLALLGIFLIALGVYHWMMPKGERFAFLIALIIGVVVGGLRRHPFRTVGIVPYASAGLAVCAIWAASTDNWINPAIGMAAFIGMMVGPLLTIYQINQPDDKRGHGGAILHCGWAFLTGCFLAFLLFFVSNPAMSRPFVRYGILSLSLIGLIFAWLVFFRAAFEFVIEILFWPIYRVKGIGPGMNAMPWKGPALYIGNHAAWFDPIWLSNVALSPTTYMMTSKFYDIKFLGWLMRQVYGAIRVPDVHMRKEAPEIQDAIAALDRGETVVIFPEGWLRRKEEQELRRFGRGVWQILAARPNTPVYACWIEGNWGSYVSWKGGPPVKGKRFDFWRHITVSMIEPITLDAATLATHMQTRNHLMKAVLEARALQGLPPIDPFVLRSSEEESDKKEGEA